MHTRCIAWQRRGGVAENAQRLRLIRLPGDCPELNPEELLNQDVKTNALGKSRPTNKAQMLSRLRSHLHRRQKQPQIIRNLFRKSMSALPPDPIHALFAGLLSMSKSCVAS